MDNGQSKTALEVTHTLEPRNGAFGRQYAIATFPSATDANGMTPLHVAVRQKSEEIVKLLLERGANVNAQNAKSLETPLHVAINHRRPSKIILNCLLDHGANIEAADSKGMTPLHIAVRQQNEQIVKLLLEKGAKIEALTAGGCTPLQLAFKHETPSGPIINYLLDRGAGIRDADFITPSTVPARFLCAASRVSPAFPPLFFDPFNPKTRETKDTELQAAVMEGSEDILELR
jgi:hypothetical protein